MNMTHINAPNTASMLVQKYISDLRTKRPYPGVIAVIILKYKYAKKESSPSIPFMCQNSTEKPTTARSQIPSVLKGYTP